MADHVYQDDHASATHNARDYSRPTPYSIAAAEACQARERAAFTRSTGVRLKEDGTTDRSYNRGRLTQAGSFISA